MMRLLVILAACAPPPRPPAPRAPAADLPALYAPLFEAGRRWTLPAHAEKRWNDGDGVEHATSAGTVTCWVAAAHAVRGGHVARIDCHTAVPDRSVLELDATGEPADSPAGWYVGTAAGLWQVQPSFGGPELTNDVAALVPEQRLLAAQPTPGKLRDAEGAHEVMTERVNSAWCFVRAFDLDWCPGGWSLCLSDGDGIVGGSMFQWGVDTRLVVFGDGIAEPQP